MSCGPRSLRSRFDPAVVPPAKCLGQARRAVGAAGRIRGDVAVLALAAALTAACAAAPAPPVTAPSRDRLEAFLQHSPAAAAIAEAARAEGLLATSAGNIADLEIVTASLGIARVDQLEGRLERVTDEAAALFAALDERRRGSRTGDVAHWVAVALLALDPTEPTGEPLLAGIDWQGDYLADVLELRRVHRRGELQQLAITPAERQPQPYATVVAPRVQPAHRPVIRARRQSGYWPVFDAPGSRTIAATIALQEDIVMAWDELRVLVRTPGEGRVIAAPEAPLARHRLADGGVLTPDGETTLQPGQQLGILAQIPGQATLALLASGAVVEIPWLQNCCQLLQRGDADWWVRLSEGSAAGTWLLASGDDFSLAWPALEAVARRARERASRQPAPRLGPLRRAGMVAVYGDARLSYWLRGTPDAAPLFVLHDATNSSRLLQDPLTALLGDDFLLLFYDPRGTGYSEAGIDAALLGAARAAVDLDQMRRAAELERIDVLGHGRGASRALQYALDYPQHVGRLVLVDPVPAPELGDKLKRVAVPVLVVVGGDDGEPPAAMRAVAEALPEARLVVLDDLAGFPRLAPDSPFPSLLATFLRR